MGNRLSKIYTRTGDHGETGLGDGKRVAKDCQRIEVIGTVDELNCAIGRVLVHKLRDNIRECLQEVQHKLFDLGGEISIPSSQTMNRDDVERLESVLNDLNGHLPPLKEFILPSGDHATADCHMARSICRRAERRLVTLSRSENIGEYAQIYLNRLSDLLFVMCRTFARDDGGVEVLWRNQNRM
jgi:cob(I)alamin adenosyltransferase